MREVDHGLVDKYLVRITSNIHSKSCPKGPTFTVEPDQGAISGTVPGDRTDDRKAVGNGPGGASTIASNRGCWSASRQTAGSFGRFFARRRPQDAGTGQPNAWPVLWRACGCGLMEPRGEAARKRPDALLRSGDVELQWQRLADGTPGAPGRPHCDPVGRPMTILLVGDERA